MTPAQPAVSCLMPAHDAAAHVGEALASLAAQSCGSFEVVLVDDGSTDGTADAARAALPDGRLRVLSPGRIGLVAALGVGLASCRAEIVARADADDRSHPERLARQLAYLAENPDVAIAGCQVRTFGAGEGYRLYDAWQNALLAHEEMAREAFVESPLSHGSVVFRASAVRALGGYRDAGWAEDYDLWLRALAAGLRLGKVPELLLESRDWPGRTSRRDPRYGSGALLAAKAHFLARGPLARFPAAVVWGAGPTGRRLAARLRHEGATVEAFVDVDPKKVGRTRQGAPVVAPADLGSLKGRLLVAAVAARGARDLIRPAARAAGFVEGVDFYCAA